MCGRLEGALAVKDIFQLRRPPALVLGVCLLAALGLASSAEAAFPGLNGKVAFSSNRDGNSEIYVMAPDGSAQTRLTNNPAEDSRPAFSPDGHRIAFQRDVAGTNDFDIYVMNADGSGETRLTSNSADDARPAFSPDGQTIVFRSDRDGKSQIYSMAPDGSRQLRLTKNTDNYDTDPSFSPDGRRIVFVRGVGGRLNRDVYVMNADGSGETRLTSLNDIEADPTFSPDGSRIAFTRDPFDGPDGMSDGIYVMAPDGSAQTRLTNNPDRDVDPAFSPDGRRIAFRSERDSWEIYSMAPDGSAQVNLTKSPASEFEPDWQRIPAATALPTRPVAFRDLTPPSLMTYRLSPARFRAAASGDSVGVARAKVGTRVRYSLSEAASVRFTVERAAAGRRRQGKCRKATRTNRRAPRCTRYLELRGSFTHVGGQGPNSFRFAGRLGGRKLRAGRYRLAATATDGAANKSRSKRVEFRIVRR